MSQVNCDRLLLYLEDCTISILPTGAPSFCFPQKRFRLVASFLSVQILLALIFRLWVQKTYATQLVRGVSLHISSADSGWVEYREEVSVK